MTVPRTFHFVFGLRAQSEPFHLAHYLCLESCRQVNDPHRILFHCHHLPHGPWWERISDHLEIVPVEPEAFVIEHDSYFDHEEGRFIQGLDLGYAHQSDFIRLRALLEHGGVYADMDTLFVRPLPDSYFEAEFLIGQEHLEGVGDPHRRERSLCNAFMVAAQQSPFAERWLARMYDVFDGTWSRHSCEEVTDLADQHPDDVTVVGPTGHFHFPCTREGLHLIFGQAAALPEELLSIHLWAHTWWSRLRTDFSAFHAGDLTEDYVRRSDTTYANAARRFLP